MNATGTEQRPSFWRRLFHLGPKKPKKPKPPKQNKPTVGHYTVNHTKPSNVGHGVFVGDENHHHHHHNDDDDNNDPIPTAAVNGVDMPDMANVMGQSNDADNVKPDSGGGYDTVGNDTGGGDSAADDIKRGTWGDSGGNDNTKPDGYNGGSWGDGAADDQKKDTWGDSGGGYDYGGNDSGGGDSGRGGGGGDSGGGGGCD